MSSNRMTRTACRRHRNGLTMIEVVMSTLIVSMILVAALSCVAAVMSGRRQVSDTVHARHLAQQLMVEIQQQEYAEPNDTPVFGTEGIESSINRSNWDDVDDYHGWASSPPADRAGTDLANTTGWERSVIVEYVDPYSPTTVVGSDRGLKRITVLVSVQTTGDVLATAQSIRSDRYVNGD